MPFRQGNPFIAQHRPKNRQLDPLERRRNQREMPRARDAIENHAGDIDVVSISGTAKRDRGRGLGLAGDIEHQHDRPSQQRRQIGRGAGAGLSARRGAVEQSHHAFGNGNICFHRRGGRQRRDQVRTHRPAIEIITRATGRDLVECRIDIVRTAFERLHVVAATAKRAQQPERHGGLAGAGTRRGDDEARCTGGMHHGRPTMLARSCWRIDAIAPTITMAGEPMPSRAASATAIPSEVSITRSSDVVDELMTTAGVSRAMPPRSNALMMSGKFAIGM